MERYNRVINPMLVKLSISPGKWNRVLELVEFAINNTVYRSTNETPCKLLFGRNQFGIINDKLRVKVLKHEIMKKDTWWQHVMQLHKLFRNVKKRMNKFIIVHTKRQLCTKPAIML